MGILAYVQALWAADSFTLMALWSCLELICVRLVQERSWLTGDQRVCDLVGARCLWIHRIIL